ncbi:MAG TPA: low specificity L-threonine aldolase [Solirubrobacterales bacterium]
MSDRHPRGFASDNNSGVHPDVLAAITAANDGHVVAYGDDDYTAAARDRFREHFGEGAEPFPVFNGSGANVASVDALTRPYEGVICTEVAHMHVDECGAPERLAGAKLLTVPTDDGKLAPDDVRRWEEGRGDEHRVQPRVVSITQATELGTVYTAEETRAIAEAAHELDMYLHVDGARLANAAASLDLPLRALTTDLGVDVLSFGGTKNGLLLGDAVVFLRPGLAETFPFTRKQLGQLASKMRFLAVQFDALLDGDLWRTNASHANAMAGRLADEVAKLDGAEIAYPVEANGVFLNLPAAAIDGLRNALPASLPFYVWDEAAGTIRLMCSWDTTEDDVDGLVTALAEAL